MVRSEDILNCSSVLKIEGNKENLSSLYRINTDSRTIGPGECFLAIKGERFDGFKFVENVLAKTNLIILEQTPDNIIKVSELVISYPEKVFIIVENSIKYTQELASLHVQNWLKKSGREIIAISGSNGKTTTKEMLAYLLKSINENNVIKTEKNNNNHLGVPFTLFQISEQTQFAVVEYGSNHPGEMKTICDCSHPTIGITTNVGDTHMEFFETVEDVFKEESLIYNYINDGLFLINQDDQYLKNLKLNGNAKTFSLKDEADFSYKYNRIENTISVNGVVLSNNNIMGEHNFLNLANAFVLAHHLYPNELEKLKIACVNFTPTDNRSQWIDWRGKKVFLDAYNANPSSMRQSAIEFYHAFCNNFPDQSRCLLLVGDMNELGQNSQKYHQELAQYLSDLDRADIIYLGRFHEYFESGAKDNLLISKNEVELSANEFSLFENYKWIFAKASRSLQLESVLDIKKSTT